MAQPSSQTTVLEADGTENGDGDDDDNGHSSFQLGLYLDLVLARSVPLFSQMRLRVGFI